MNPLFKKEQEWIQNILEKVSSFSHFLIKPIRTVTFIIALASSLISTSLLAVEEDPHKSFNWMGKLISFFSGTPPVEKEILSVVTIENHKGVGFVVQDDKTNKIILVITLDAIKDVDPSSLKFMNQGNPLKIKRIWSASIEQNVISFELEDYNGYALNPADSPDYNSDEVYIPGHPDAYFSDIKGPSLHNVSSPIFGIISDETVESPQKGGGPVLNSKGEVIGMYLQKDITAPGIYFAVKIEHLQNLLRNPKISVDKPDVFLTKSLEEQIEYFQTLTTTSNDFNNFYFNEGTDLTEYFSGEAFARLKDIANKGSANAQFKKGLQLYFGQDVLENKEQAAFWFGQAAGQNHPEAEAILPEFYKQQFRQPIQKGRAKGIYLLAQKLYKGEGIPQDKEEAAKNFRRATIEYLFVEQSNQLDEMIKTFSRNDEHSNKIVRRVLKEIKKRTFIFPYQYKAAFQLAVMLYNGDGISQRKREAFFWFSKILNSYYTLSSQIRQVRSQETADDLEDELFERYMDTGEDGLEELIEIVDENRFKELLKIAAIRSQTEELIKIREEIDEIFFAARHKMIVMLKTGDGIPSNQKVADQLLYEREQRMMTQQEWNHITEPEEITEMKKRIREVKNNIIPEIDTEKGVAMVMERIQEFEEERAKQERPSQMDESQGSLCSGEFRSNKKGPSRGTH